MVEWSRSLALGVPEIDKQHKQLLERAARFESAIRAGVPPYQLDALFGYLKEYVRTHFDAEERLMREAGYPRVAEHIEEHSNIRARLDALLPRWEAEGESATVLMALQGLLDAWVSSHVADSDQRLADFLRK